MPARKNGTAVSIRSSADAYAKGDRFTILTTAETGERIRMACIQTNSTVSECLIWCIERSLADYVRHHRISGIRLRPGRKLGRERDRDSSSR